MLSGTSTDSRKLPCSRATVLEQVKISSQLQAYFQPMKVIAILAYESNSYIFELKNKFFEYTNFL